jgi:hypothetical protein
MSQLTFASIPGFFDLGDAAIAGGQALTDDAIAKISHNAKFGAVRCERIYMGFYKHGDTVGTPPSPVDGYAYTRAEIQYDFRVFSTRAPGLGFVSGQAARPPIASAQNSSFYFGNYDIDDSTGLVYCETHYFDQGVQPETTTNDGILKVYALCQRSSLNVAN